MGDVHKLKSILKDRPDKTDWWLKNIENRWNRWTNNDILLWGITLKYFVLCAVFNRGDRVHPDASDSETEEMPISPAEFFGEEFVSGSIKDQIGENAPAKFWQFYMKVFYKEEPTELELAAIGITEKRDLLLSISVDLFRYESDRVIDDTHEFARTPLIPLPLDLLELQPYGNLDPKWAAADKRDSYYTYFPGRRFYRIKEVLPFPGVFSSPPISCVCTASYDREYREVLAINSI